MEVLDIVGLKLDIANGLPKISFAKIFSHDSVQICFLATVLWPVQNTCGYGQIFIEL